MTHCRGQRFMGRIAVSTAIVLFGALALPAGATGAAGKANASVDGSESVTSGTWGAKATASVLTFTTNVAQTSTVANTGTVALSAVGYTVTISNPASGSPSFTIFACATAWSGGKCSGGTGTKVGTTYAKNTTTPVTSTVVPAVGGSVYLQATPSGVTSSVSMTLVTTITSAGQLRAPVVTNQ